MSVAVADTRSRELIGLTPFSQCQKGMYGVINPPMAPAIISSDPSAHTSVGSSMNAWARKVSAASQLAMLLLLTLSAIDTAELDQ